MKYLATILLFITLNSCLGMYPKIVVNNKGKIVNENQKINICHIVH